MRTGIDPPAEGKRDGEVDAEIVGRLLRSRAFFGCRCDSSSATALAQAPRTEQSPFSMFAAQTIYLTGAGPQTLYSPWMARGADYGVFMIEIAKVSYSYEELTLSVQMIHKNSDQTGDGTNVGSPLVIAMDLLVDQTLFYFEVTSGFKELVRYQFTVAFAGGTSETNWVTFRALAPKWFANVRP